MAYFWPIISAIASGTASAASGTKGPVAQPGQAPAGNARQQIERIQATGDLMSQAASMNKHAMAGGDLTANRAPAVSSGSGGAQMQVMSPMKSMMQPMSPQGANAGAPMPQMAYGSPQGSAMMGSGGGPAPMISPSASAPQVNSMQYNAPIGPPPPSGAAASGASGASGAASGSKLGSSASAAGNYAALAGALASIAQSTKGQSVQAPGFMPGTVSGMRPSISARGSGGGMDVEQLIRMLSQRGGGRRRL